MRRTQWSELARKGFNSYWGDFKAEGIVARPAFELKARNGKRLITKIKYKDFGNAGPEEIRDARIMMTIVDGVVVFEQKN